MLNGKLQTRLYSYAHSLYSGATSQVTVCYIANGVLPMAPNARIHFLGVIAPKL